MYCVKGMTTSLLYGRPTVTAVTLIKSSFAVGKLYIRGKRRDVIFH